MQIKSRKNMEFERKKFISRLKNVKDIFLEFKSVANKINEFTLKYYCDRIAPIRNTRRNNLRTPILEAIRNTFHIFFFWKDLHDSNNLCDSFANASDLLNASDTNFRFPGNHLDGYVNRDDSCLSKGSLKSINQIQSFQTNPVSILASTCSLNNNGCSNVLYELDRNNWSKSDPANNFGGAYIGNVCSKENVPSELDRSNWSKSDPANNFGGAYIGNVCSKENVPSELDRSNWSKSDPANNFGGAYIGNVCSKENVPSELDRSNWSKSDPANNFGGAYIGNVCSKENVIGFEMPTVYGFDEKSLECVLKEASSKNVVNYLYYLTDNNDEHDTFNYRMDTDVGIGESTTLLTQKNHAYQGEYEFTSNFDGDNALAIGLTGWPAVVNSVEANVTAEPISTSSNVIVSSLIVDSPITAHRECDDEVDCDCEVDCEVDCEDDFIDFETFEIERNRGCDSSKMIVPTSDSGPKEYCCKYCKGRPQKLERHLRTVHKNEEDVKKYLAFPPRSAPRRKILLKILKQGDFICNNDAELNGGKYAVRRRPNKHKDPWDLIPCPKCLGAYSKSYLTRHWNKECGKNPLAGERGIHQLGRAVEGRLHPDASKDLVWLFARFAENENIRNIRFDWLIICYGNDLCLNHSPHYQQRYICDKLAAAGKVLRASKSISTEITDMSSLFDVEHCNTVIGAIYSMGKFDPKTKRFGSPSTALATVTLINTIGERLFVEAMKLKDREKESEVERFLTVFKKEVKTKINKLAAATRLENLRHKKENIPTTADVIKLATFLDSERETYFVQLTQKFSYGVWLKLSQLTMASILIYNRRRAGEMQNLLKDDFKLREIVADQCEMLVNDIPKAARKKIKSRLVVRNKLGKRLVPVLLKHHWDDCLELLIGHRTDAGIPEKNEYLFALPTKLGRIRTDNVCTIIRSLSLLCGAENPSSLRGTYLRKHMASYCSTKNLSDNDISNLADFMGHAEAVHRAYYRINPLTHQVGKMSFLLDSALGNDSDVDSEDQSDESDSELEADNSLNSTRANANKKRKPAMLTKKKRNVQPKGATKSRKKSVTDVKRKRNVPSDESDSESEADNSLNSTRANANKKRKPAMLTKKKRNVQPKGATKSRKKSVTEVKRKRNVSRLTKRKMK